MKQNNPPKIKAAHGPEYYIQKKIIKFLQERGWYIERMAMGMYMNGIPDLYVHHPKYGSRWLEIKKDKVHYTFTRAQKYKFPIWESVGIGIWIMTDIEDYDVLFGKPNWRDFWKPSWDNEMNIDLIMEQEYGRWLEE